MWNKQYSIFLLVLIISITINQASAEESEMTDMPFANHTNLPPLKQLKYVQSSTDVVCNENLVLMFKKTNNSPACVKHTTMEKLIERGWIMPDKEINPDVIKNDFNELEMNWHDPDMHDYDQLALQIAHNFILEQSITFAYDGINNSVKLTIAGIDETNPPRYYITGTFDTEYEGYGNRMGQEVAKSKTTHDIELGIANGKVTIAKIDGVWDELNQTFIIK